MHRVVPVMILTLGFLLIGCAQNTPMEHKEKQSGVEQAVSIGKPECDPSLPMYKQPPRCQTQDMRARIEQAALNKPVTVKVLNSFDDSDSAALLTCQAEHYAARHGQKATEKHIEDLTSGLLLADYMNDEHKDQFDKQMIKNLQDQGIEPVQAKKGYDDTVQAQLIEEGYTCSRSEMYDVQNSVTATASAAGS